MAATDNNKLIDIAEEIHISLDQPSDISIVGTVFWLRGNIGLLNIRTTENFEVAENGEITPEINDDAKAIFKKLYSIYYYGRMISSNLGASGFSSVQEIDSDGAKIKMVNKTELAKIYKDLKKQEEESLVSLLNLYRFNKGRPKAVHGDDTVFELYNGNS